MSLDARQRVISRREAWWGGRRWVRLPVVLRLEFRSCGVRAARKVLVRGATVRGGVGQLHKAAGPSRHVTATRRRSSSGVCANDPKRMLAWATGRRTSGRTAARYVPGLVGLEAYLVVVAGNERRACRARLRAPRSCGSVAARGLPLSPPGSDGSQGLERDSTSRPAGMCISSARRPEDASTTSGTRTATPTAWRRR